MPGRRAFQSSIPIAPPIKKNVSPNASRRNHRRPARHDAFVRALEKNSVRHHVGLQGIWNIPPSRLKNARPFFFSSGTTEQKPSRHFHNAESLAVYEASLWTAFRQRFFADAKSAGRAAKLICLTPPPAQVPHSSLVHMFETVRQITAKRADSVFFGKTDPANSWILDFASSLKSLKPIESGKPLTLLLVTAFSFVHLLDFWRKINMKFQLPENSRVMETGGYKNRSRTMPKAELHALITNILGVAARKYHL